MESRQPDPADAATWLQDAIEDHRAGRLDDAVAKYDRILAVLPDYFDALHLSGLIALAKGDLARATDRFETAVRLHPSAYPAYDSLGLALQAAGQKARAEASFRQAIALNPEFVQAQENLGRLLYADARMDEAATVFGSVARLLPESAAAQNNLGTVLGAGRRYVEAQRCYEQALMLDPAFADASVNLAELFMLASRYEEAEARYRAALASSAPGANVLYRLGYALYRQGRRTDAMAAFDAALSRDPECVEARWARTMSELPMGYADGELPARFRTGFSDSLDALDRWFDQGREAIGHRAVGNQQPFYLAFHDVPNVGLLCRYGDLCSRLMGSWASTLPARPPGRSRGPQRRIGIVSGFFCDQSVWTAIVRGWCAHLDRGRFELHMMSTGMLDDAETARARSYAESFHSGLPGLADWVRLIGEHRLDVILYPEIGMDRMSAKLASLRLAPVQAAAWGHPETTGLPTIDYYLSAAAFEPPEARRNYRETLVALPGIGVCYEALDPAPAAVDWAALGVDRGQPVLVCAATPYKYLPDHDRVLVEIARRLGQCQFVFFRDVAAGLSRQLEQRLQQAFARAGLDAQRFVRFVPRHARPAFFELMRQSDVYLDTFGFSGFNTAMQAVECALPVVTCEGRFMRGRLAAGILRQMGMPELVAADEREYIDLVLRLCRDGAFMQQVRTRLRERRATLFDDTAPVRALEAFLESATART